MSRVIYIGLGRLLTANEIEKYTKVRGTTQLGRRAKVRVDVKPSAQDEE